MFLDSRSDFLGGTRFDELLLNIEGFLSQSKYRPELFLH
jgi:hypothetical protein